MNYRERMRWLTSEIRHRIASVEITGVTDRNVRLLEVTAGLLRCCVEQTDALNVLLAAQKFEGSFVVQRSIWEYWKEFEFLAGRPTAADDAVRFEANTLLDVLETLHSLPQRDDGALQQTEAWLKLREAAYPTIVSEVRTRRAKRPGHWSGEARSKIFAPAGSGRVTYRALSWQAHPELGVFREVNVKVGVGKAILRIVPEAMNRDEVGERAAWGATGMLWHFWCEFASLWKLDTFTLPEARASA